MSVPTVLITGASSGLGLATARILQARGVRTILASRSAGKGQQASDPSDVAAGGTSFVEVDLTDLASVARAAEAVRTMAPSGIDALVCNAGLQIVTELSKTPAGIEATFAANHLGHFALVRALLPSMVPNGRIVLVASGTHDPSEHTGMPAPVLDDLEGVAHGTAFKGEPIGTAGRRRYTTSKLCNVLTTYELQRRIGHSPFAEKGIAVVAFDPGLMPTTGLSRDYGPVSRTLFRWIAPLLMVIPNVNRVSTSARRLAALALSPSPETLAGRYVSRGKPRRSSEQSYDEALAKRLWSLSSKLVGLPETVTETG